MPTPDRIFEMKVEDAYYRMRRRLFFGVLAVSDLVNLGVVYLLQMSGLTELSIIIMLVWLLLFLVIFALWLWKWKPPEIAGHYMLAWRLHGVSEALSHLYDSKASIWKYREETRILRNTIDSHLQSLPKPSKLIAGPGITESRTLQDLKQLVLRLESITPQFPIDRRRHITENLLILANGVCAHGINEITSTFISTQLLNLSDLPSKPPVTLAGQLRETLRPIPYWGQYITAILVAEAIAWFALPYLGITDNYQRIVLPSTILGPLFAMVYSQRKKS